MKTKVTPRKITAHYTTNPARIAELIAEADKITMPEHIYKQAADLAASIHANIPKTGLYAGLDTVASYLVRYAYLLSQSGELVEAPPKKKKGREIQWLKKNAQSLAKKRTNLASGIIMTAMRLCHVFNSKRGTVVKSATVNIMLMFKDTERQ